MESNSPVLSALPIRFQFLSPFLTGEEGIASAQAKLKLSDKGNVVFPADAGER